MHPHNHVHVQTCTHMHVRTACMNIHIQICTYIAQEHTHANKHVQTCLIKSTPFVADHHGALAVQKVALAVQKVALAVQKVALAPFIQSVPLALVTFYTAITLSWLWDSLFSIHN